MNNGINITCSDSEGRSQRHEIWFHENFLAVHVHGFTDNEGFAKICTRHRFIWGCWYYCCETFIPKFVFREIVESEECIEQFVKWYKQKNDSIR